ncbi:MAG: tetratricopeptide repeat protein [Phycisphaerales bacterium]|nr:tetratricopeptide repeat protein [Phycisphaerales bacterium]
MRWTTRAASLALCTALSAGLALQARADDKGPLPVSPAVQRFLDTPYLTDSERADIRVRHGLWKPEDLSDPARRAKASLIRGCWDDASLSDAKADPIDRADAAVRRGEFAGALEIINAANSNSLRAARLKALALDATGKHDDARAVRTEIDRRLNKDRQSSSRELVEGVRSLHERTRIDGPGNASQSFQSLMSMLARAREQLDRLSWEASLAEAEILDEKDNGPEAREAIQQALELNNAAADAWYLLGRMAVDGFDFDRAEKVADRLRELAKPIEVSDAPPSPEAASGVAPLADMLTARIRLRQRDPKAAAESLAPTLARYPKLLEARALEAAASATAFDTPGTDAKLAALDALSPGTPIGYFAVGKALAEQRQYADAAKYLEEASKRAPKHAEVWIELGLLEVQAARDDRALAALERAALLDPFNVRASNSLKLVRDVGAFSRVETDHFIVRYRPGVDQVLAREMPAVLERIFARVTGDKPGGIRHVPRTKTVIELMPDHHWFSVRITGMPQVHTMAAATGPLIAMEAPRLSDQSKVGAYDWARVVQHEYTHTVTLDRTNNRLPHWFTEAAAVYLEDSPKDWSAVQILARAYETNTLFDFEEINIAFTRPKKPTDRGQAYAQGAWMYEFMVERFGPEAPLKLMDRYAAGDREPEAFQTVLGASREQFFEQFHTWAGEQLVAWGMKPKPGQPEYRDLLAKWEEGNAKAHDQNEAGPAANPDAHPQAKPDAPGDEKPMAKKLGRARHRAEDEGPSQDVIDAWLKDYPTHPDVLEMALLSRLAASNGKLTPESIDLATRFAAARPVDPMPHRQLAALYLDAESPAHDPAKAIEHLEYLDAREQNSSSVAAQLARLYAEQGDLDKAWNKIVRATTVGPYEAPIRELAATIAIQRQQFDDAKWQLEALTMLEPDRAIHKERLAALEKLRTSRRP